jgi:tetratricopeptide (TPR) repeat protein
MMRKRYAAVLFFALLAVSGPAAADALGDAGAAFQAAQRGNDTLAVRYYTRALWSGELSGIEQAATHFLRAQAYVRLADYDRAVEDYDQAIVIDPAFAAAYYNRGVTNAARGKLSAALDDYSAAIRFDYPDLHKPLFNRGEIYEARGDFDRAVADFKAAFVLAPDASPVRAKAKALGLKP